SLRLLFLVLKHGVDISRTYHGQITSVSVAKPFRLTDNVALIPTLAKEYLSSSFVNYYYGVKDDEVGTFDAYQAKTATNDLLGITININLSENTSLTCNYSHKKFDQVIYDSPTIRLEAYNTISLFGNYTI